MKAHLALKGESSLSTIDTFVLTGTIRMPSILKCCRLFIIVAGHFNLLTTVSGFSLHLLHVGDVSLKILLAQ